MGSAVVAQRTPPAVETPNSTLRSKSRCGHCHASARCIFGASFVDAPAPACRSTTVASPSTLRTAKRGPTRTRLPCAANAPPRGSGLTSSSYALVEAPTPSIAARNDAAPTVRRCDQAPPTSKATWPSGEWSSATPLVLESPPACESPSHSRPGQFELSQTTSRPSSTTGASASPWVTSGCGRGVKNTRYMASSALAPSSTVACAFKAQRQTS
mmetsp:Transcript_19644/g.67450  ORF Transcript_19644/g.67450 Transcript_19644/m.67450 type:complete len:213 (-) Transcript_19644:8-646(-)